VVVGGLRGCCWRLLLCLACVGGVVVGRCAVGCLRGRAWCLVVGFCLSAAACRVWWGVVGVGVCGGVLGVLSSVGCWWVLHTAPCVWWGWVGLGLVVWVFFEKCIVDASIL
jgi:hypothetical protein